MTAVGTARWTTIVAVMALAASLVGVSPATGQADEVPLDADRVAGADRYATAAELARRAADGRETPRVWLATGENYPDALAAGATGEPVVLVTRTTVPPASAEALRDIDPDEVVAVGGQVAISDATLAAAGSHAGARTQRASGPDRFATSAAVAQRTHPDGADVVWVATGLGFVDALSAGPVAAVERAPLLLVSRDGITAEVREQLERLEPDEVVVVGGTAVVSTATADQAAATAGGADVTRLAGGDRFATSAAIAQRGHAAHDLRAHPHLATAQNFPDALAAGPAAARAGGPLLLATRTRIPDATREALLGLDPDRVTLAGGTAALSATVFERARRPWLVGACDLYDVPDPTPIQGHPENQRPSLDAWSGPWVIDDFRDAWGISVPYRWRQDKVEAFEHRGVLFYVDTEDGYDHWLRVTVFCGNPYLMGGDVALDADDPQQIADRGPHAGRGQPDYERLGGPALYTAAWFGESESQRYDYVAVDDDVILIHYAATNRFARNLSGSVGQIADEVAASVAPIAEVQCPPNASDCVRRD